LRKLDLYELFLPPFLKERVAPKNLNEGKAWVRTLPRAKFLLKLFSKSLSCAAGETAVARRNERNNHGLFFLQAFSFGPFASKEKALSAENDL
jgi:hypothetical protein